MGGGESKPSPQVIVVKAPEAAPAAAPAPIPHTPETTLMGTACPVDTPYAYGVRCIDNRNICPTGYRLPTLLESATDAVPKELVCIPNDSSFLSYSRADNVYNINKVGSSCPEGSQSVTDKLGNRCVRNCLPGTKPGPGVDCVPDIKDYKDPDKPFYISFFGRKQHIIPQHK